MNRRHLLFFLFLFTSITTVAFGQVYRLPQIANGQNAIRTTFIFFNNGDTSALVTVQLTGDNGSPLNWTLTRRNGTALNKAGFTLASGETIFATTSGTGTLETGAARITSTQPIGVSAVFAVLKMDGSVKTEAGIGVSEEVSQFVIAVDTEGVFNTGLAVFNSGGAVADLTFQLYRENGSAFGAPATRNDIPVNGHLAVFIDGPGGLFPSLGDFKGRLVVSSTSPVAALTLRQNVPNGAPLTTLPAVASTSNRTTFNLPHVANASTIKTQFVLFNLGSQAGTAVVSFTDNDGQPMSVTLKDGRSGSSFNINVAGNGATFVETDGKGGLKIGAVRVQSNVPMGVSAIFGILNAQAQTTVEAGVGDSPSFTEFSLPIDMTQGSKTGVALFNNGGTTATLDFEFRDDSGTLLMERSYRQAPGSIVNLGHIAKFADELKGTVAGKIGQLGVFASAPISAIGLRQGSGTLTTFPVSAGVPGDGDLPAGTELLHTSRTGVSLTSNTNIGTTTLETGFKLSGQISYPEGYFPTGGVNAIDSKGDVYTGAVSFDFSNPMNQTYSVIVPRGTFNLRFCGIGGGFGAELPPNPAPLQFGEGSTLFLGHREENVVVTQDTTKNVSVEDVALRSLSGQVGNLGELPPDTIAEGLMLILTSQNSPVQSLARVQANGSYQSEVGAGDYTATLFFGEGTDLDDDGQIDEYERVASLYDIGRTTVASQSAAPLATANFSVPDLVTVSGKVTQPNTANYSDGSVFAGDPSFIQDSLIEQCFPAVGASFSSLNGTGNYTIRILQNRTYNISAGLPATSIGTDEEGGVLSPFDNRRSFSADATLNLNVPAFPQQVQLSGKVVDDQGQPVEGVMVSAFTTSLTGAANTTFSADTTTDAQGNFSVTVLSGTNYTIRFDPPREGFSFPFSSR